MMQGTAGMQHSGIVGQRQQYPGQLQGGQLQGTTRLGDAEADVNQPREIGLIDRVAGIASGLSEIHARLYQLGARISGHPNEPERKPDAIPIGMHGYVAAAEASIREVLRLVEAFEREF